VVDFHNGADFTGLGGKALLASLAFVWLNLDVNFAHRDFPQK
jgi:hypothetical protein